MAKTCGYICPVCEGLGFDKETLKDCDFCKVIEPKKEKISTDEWIKQVHEGNCCSDLGENSK